LKIPISVLVVIYKLNGDVLLIERADRNQFWQSVTGSLDAPDEALAQAASREVFEETGLEVKIIEELGSIHYEFSTPTAVISKTVHHFLMKQTGGTLTIDNDPDHEAVDIRWINIDLLADELTHENERRLALIVQEWVAKQ
jgi:8-oxo-dGTP pyrophosphatase MutT (NUDIX family)